MPRKARKINGASLDFNFPNVQHLNEDDDDDENLSLNSEEEGGEEEEEVENKETASQEQKIPASNNIKSSTVKQRRCPWFIGNSSTPMASQLYRVQQTAVVLDELYRESLAFIDNATKDIDFTKTIQSILEADVLNDEQFMRQCFKDDAVMELVRSKWIGQLQHGLGVPESGSKAQSPKVEILSPGLSDGVDSVCQQDIGTRISEDEDNSTLGGREDQESTVPSTYDRKTLAEIPAELVYTCHPTVYQKLMNLTGSAPLITESPVKKGKDRHLPADSEALDQFRRETGDLLPSRLRQLLDMGTKLNSIHSDFPKKTQQVVYPLNELPGSKETDTKRQPSKRKRLYVPQKLRLKRQEFKNDLYKSEYRMVIGRYKIISNTLLGRCCKLGALRKENVVGFRQRTFMEMNLLKQPVPAYTGHSFVPLEGPDLLLNIAFFTARRPRTKLQEFTIYSHQTLSAFRDCLFCPRDHLINDGGRSQRQKSTSFFFIEGQFYIDQRQEGSQSEQMAEPILQWQQKVNQEFSLQYGGISGPKSSKMSPKDFFMRPIDESLIDLQLGTELASKPSEFEVMQDWLVGMGESAVLKTERRFKSMHETRWCDLELRINYPYPFVHQQDCQHTIMITSMRLYRPDQTDHGAPQEVHTAAGGIFEFDLPSSPDPFPPKTASNLPPSIPFTSPRPLRQQTNLSHLQQSPTARSTESENISLTSGGMKHIPPLPAPSDDNNALSYPICIFQKPENRIICTYCGRGVYCIGGLPIRHVAVEDQLLTTQFPFAQYCEGCLDQLHSTTVEKTQNSISGYTLRFPVVSEVPDDLVLP